MRALLAIILALEAHAQMSPPELAKAVVQQWSTGSEASFAAVYPFREGRNDFASRPSRSSGLANAIRTSDSRAVLLLSGVPAFANSGDATILGRGFSSLYEARAEGDRWKLTARIPPENTGQILAHLMKVSIRPGDGLSVEDRMRIRVKGADGFAVRLNHAAKIEHISAAAHAFGGGLLWADLPEGETELTIRYSIAVEKGPADTNSACFLEDSGHVRNQYFWHPFFEFNSPNNWADFSIEVRIPRDYRVSTSLPQTERVEGAERVIEARTIQKAAALTLVYDRAWKVESQRMGDVRLDLFLLPETQPSRAVIADAVRSIYSLLSQRFGALPAGYMGIVQARSWKDNPGWRFNSNQIVVAGNTPGIVSIKDFLPSAPLGHEIAHFWTQGAGPAASFLSEGWAVWAESQILENEFGHETAREFWKTRAENYWSSYDGKVSLLEDDNNSGVAYAKGPWIFHMLEEALGADAFRKAMADYSRRSLAQPAGWEVLAECTHAREFLLPWLMGKSAPHLTTRVDGRTVTIRQEPPDFVLPVTIEATTAQGRERQRIWTKGPETAATFSADVSDVRVDPDGALLLRH